MKRLVTALVILSLVALVGCDKNDENTISSLPKTHLTFPTIHLQIDNGYRVFGVDSALLTVSPSVGWHDTVRTDANGFIGALAAGTYIVAIDTIPNGADTTYDTTAAVVGFAPGVEYTFTLSRTNPYSWIDSFSVVYATTVDSFWRVLASDTEMTVKFADPSRPPVRVIDSIAKLARISDTTGKRVDSIYRQEVLRGWWFGQRYVIPNFDTASTAAYPPDSMKIDTFIWAYWKRTDSFYYPYDSTVWCQWHDSIVVDTTTDIYGNMMFSVDTFPAIEKETCDTSILKPPLKTRIYRTKGWSQYDTTAYYAYPDTTKELVFGDSIYIHNTVSGETRRAVIKLINGMDNSVTELDAIEFKGIMPILEQYKYPDFKIIIEN